MFWGLILEANKRYSQTVLKSFHLSQAVLDVTKSTDNDVVVTLASEEQNYILCTLKKGKTIQVALDLMFSEGDDISFSCTGGCVHLAGYLIPDDPELGYDGLGGEEFSDEEEEEEEVSPAEVKSKKSKKRSLEELLGEEIEEDSDDDDFENGQDAEEGSEEESEGDLDDEEDDSEEEEEEEEVVVPPAKVAKLDKKAKKQQNGVATPVVATKEPKNKKEAAAAAQKKAASPKEQVLAGGLKIEEIVQGKGPDAKSGKKVQVYYTGRLKSNNKVFDSTTSGQGFKFLLGRGEVIRGWDVGVAGMKVGGKRRITCPPGMAYGAKGSPPVIPANATLVFDVELRGVN